MPEQFEQHRIAGSRHGSPRGIEPIRLRLPADTGSVPVARRALVEFAREHRADPEAVAIAVSEAVGNAVLHGYRYGSSGPITIEAQREADPDELLIAVTDEGVGMSPHPGSPGLGLGLPLIRRCTTSLEIQRPPSGTRLVMRFELGR
jgi:serine/threonine-protein kinase RsbW